MFFIKIGPSPSIQTEIFLHFPFFLIDLAERVYRAAGSQPIRPGFDALRYTRSVDEITKVAKGYYRTKILTLNCLN